MDQLHHNTHFTEPITKLRYCKKMDFLHNYQFVWINKAVLWLHIQTTLNAPFLGIGILQIFMEMFPTVLQYHATFLLK